MMLQRKIMIISVIFNYIPQSRSSGVRTSSNGDFSFSGEYEGDLSIMYFEQNWTFSSLVNSSESTNIIPFNASYFDNEYNCK